MLDFMFQKAINSLSPNVGFTHRDNVIDEWDLGNTGTTQPTTAEIDAEIIRLQAEYDAQEYARKRKAEYDALNQFELISDDSINGTTTHKDAIAAIKTKYPKG